MADEQPTEGQEPSLAEALRAHRAERDGGDETPPEPSPGQAPPSSGTETAPASTPPWSGDFDAERAWSTIQSQRETEKELRTRLTKLEREKMGETERVQAERDDLKREVETLRLDNLRNTVAAAKGLPVNAISFLHGKDKKELESNADELLKLLGRERTAPVADFGNGARPGGDVGGEDFTSMLRRAAGRS